ncbi:MAG: hypothetical protein ACRCT8_11525 [Lacipirellulaceae bacterium]
MVAILTVGVVGSLTVLAPQRVWLRWLWRLELDDQGTARTFFGLRDRWAWDTFANGEVVRCGPAPRVWR